MRRFPPLDSAETVEKAHGRLEVRRLWSTTQLNEYLDFPHCAQVAKIERERMTLKTRQTSRETVYAIFSLKPQQADAARLLEINRSHWGIENRLHWVRDWNYDEDRCQIRSGPLPWVMATLRNVALALLRRAGYGNIAAALREMAALPHRAVGLMGL